MYPLCLIIPIKTFSPVSLEPDLIMFQVKVVYLGKFPYNLLPAADENWILTREEYVGPAWK